MIFRYGAVATLLLLAVTQPATAQDLTLSLGDDGSLTARGIQLILLLTVLSLAPGIAIMVTCFPFIVTVLSILRQALGLQQSPPNMLIITLALFLTYYVMEPVFTQAWTAGLQPILDDTLPLEEGLKRVFEPFQVFMAARVEPETYIAMAELRGATALSTPTADAPPSILIPSFLLSEMSRAFQVGFLIFLPFLIIDLVVAAILMSMGMMMVPPAIVSLPFKLAFFVVADGWSLVASSLVRGYF